MHQNVAPELLSFSSLKNPNVPAPYSQAADIYSFGMIAYELFSSLCPYPEYDYDRVLAFRICEGLRPNLEELKIPQLLRDLIERC